MLKKTFLTFIIFFSIPFASQLSAEELVGKVIEVNDLDVTIRLNSDKQPRINDKVEIKFAILGGEMLSIGAWEVTRVNKNIVYAKVINYTGAPQEGQKAVIYSDNPVSPVSPKKKVKKKTKTIKPQKLEGEIIDISGDEITIKLFSKTSAQAGDKITFYTLKAKKKRHLPKEVLALIKKLKNNDSVEKSKAIKQIIKSSHKKNPDLLDTVKDELLKGYLSDYRKKYHINNMAWLCNLLGDSGNIKYKKALEIVYKKTQHKKLKKYAYKNFRRLR